MLLAMMGLLMGLLSGFVGLPTAYPQQSDRKDSPFGPKGCVDAVAVQPDGKIVVAGMFPHSVARLNADGSVDASFVNSGISEDNCETRLSNSPTMPILFFSALVIQPDGKIIADGQYRFNANGSRDESYAPVGQANGKISAVALQPDGKIIVGGEFTVFNGVARRSVVRLNADGAVDANFNAGAGAEVNSKGVFKVAVQPDGKIIVVGWFNAFGGAARNYIARLNPDGSLDPDFNPGATTDSEIKSVVLQAGGNILVGGVFNHVGDATRAGIARLHSDGSLDADFDPGDQVPWGQIYSVALQSNGKIIVGGRGIGRLHPHGKVDPEFHPASGGEEFIKTVAVQSDGKIIVHGFFRGQQDDSGHNGIYRLNADGSLDTSFHPGAPAKPSDVSITPPSGQ